MSISGDVLSTIQACSEIRLIQIPAACARVEGAVRGGLSALRFEGSTADIEAKTISVAAQSFYINIMQNAQAHQSSLSDNEYAAQSAWSWRKAAGGVLEALVDGLSGLAGVEDTYIDACKLLNKHFMYFSGAYQFAYRKRRTDELTAVIQKTEPDYRKPARNFNYFGLAVAMAIIALVLPFLGRYFSKLMLVEAAALLGCAICMKKEAVLPARIISLVPILCHLLHLLPVLRYVLASVQGLAVICGSAWYTNGGGSYTLGSVYTLSSVALGASMLFMMIVLPLYIWNVIKVDRKNSWATIPCVIGIIGATVMTVMIIVEGYYGNRTLMILAPCLSSFAMLSSAGCIVTSFGSLPKPRKAAREKKELL